MNSRPAILYCLLLLRCVGGALAADKFDFRTRLFLKHLLGEWTTEGDLKGKDGNVVRIKEDWKAEALARRSPSRTRFTFHA